MTKTIAIAGKGGTGKTTIAALLIRLLSQKGIVLAIDGDPSSNLHLALGLPLTDTVGAIREGMTKKITEGRFEVGISKPDYMDLKIREALVESERIDLLAMGRPEGPGCYCAANSMLRFSIDRIANNYDYVVIDNEAGMEHISRQTDRDVDILIITSDLSLRGIITAARMKELINELRTRVGTIVLVLNRIDSPVPPPIDKAIKDSGLEVTGLLPTDRQLLEFEITGTPLTELPPNSPLNLEITNIAKKLGLL